MYTEGRSTMYQNHTKIVGKCDAMSYNVVDDMCDRKVTECEAHTDTHRHTSHHPVAFSSATTLASPVTDTCDHLSLYMHLLEPRINQHTSEAKHLPSYTIYIYLHDDGDGDGDDDDHGAEPVSYTHLTLPTICSV
eukprot:2580275-Karenia_brevis.AAC.1